MRRYNEDGHGQEWARTEVTAATGLSPRSTPQDIQGYEPTGPHAWFGYALAEIVTLATLRRMSESWRHRPPRRDWKRHAPTLRSHADEQMLTSRLPPDTTLAEWFKVNEPLLREEPSSRERGRVVATALLPLFAMQQPESWEAFEHLDDFPTTTFNEYLAEWHAHAPKRLRWFVERVAEEFGLGVSGDR
jgi:hypothetical protein